MKSQEEPVSEKGRSLVQIFGAGIIGFAGVAGLGGILLLRPGGAAIKAPAAVYLPVDAAPALSVPSPSPFTLSGAARGGAPVGEAAAAVSSPAPLLTDDARDSNAPGATAAAVPPVPAAFAAPHLTSALPGAAPAAASAATASAASPASAASAKRAAPAPKPFVAPKLDLSKSAGSLAASIHYGVSDRSQLMGRAVGPVYNFAGRGAGGGRGAQVAADSMQPLVQVSQQADAAQKQVDASDLSDADKARIDAGLSALRQPAAIVPGQ
jgi:hypothetical protein